MLPIQLQEIIDEFSEFTEANEKYELLIEYGKELADFPEDKRTNEYLVPGCISVVYIHSIIEDNKVYFQGAADSLLVKGLVAILVQGFDGMSANEFLALNGEFITQLGLNDSLTPSRANASANIFKLMQKQVRELIN